jgi:hypothetical protein
VYDNKTANIEFNDANSVTYSGIDTSLILSDGTVLVNFTFAITVAGTPISIHSHSVSNNSVAYPAPKFVCKDKTCAATQSQCEVHDLLCPMSQPFLHEGSCINETVFNDIPAVTSVTRTFITGQNNQLSLSGSNIHLQIPATALAQFGPSAGVQMSSSSPNGKFYSLSLDVVVDIF